MKTICAKCGVLIREDGKPLPAGLPPNAVSHGLCEVHAKEANAELDKWIKDHEVVDKPKE